MIIKRDPDGYDSYHFEEGDAVVMNRNSFYGKHLKEGDIGNISLQFLDIPIGYSHINSSVIVYKDGQYGNGSTTPAWEVDPTAYTHNTARVVEVDYDGDPLEDCFMEKL